MTSDQWLCLPGSRKWIENSEIIDEKIIRPICMLYLDVHADLYPFKTET